MSEAEGRRAAQDAAIYNALDFYAFVFSQYAPRFEGGDAPTDALSAQFDPLPEGWTRSDWESWVTWAETINAGFQGAPGMCDVLNYKDDMSSYAYEPSFVAAVNEKGLCPPS
jgi:hypothetical protein